MGISLKKGQKISLTKEKPGLQKIIVGLGWDEIERKKSFFRLRTANIDCDASAIMLKNDKLTQNKDLVYYGNLKHYTGSVIHTGDNLTGEGEGDDEQIIVDLKSVPEVYNKIVIVVNIYDAVARDQHFGMIRNAFIRIVDASTNTELCKYSLTDDYSSMTALIFGELYRNNGEWKFNAIGQGTKDGSLSTLCGRYA